MRRPSGCVLLKVCVNVYICIYIIIYKNVHMYLLCMFVRMCLNMYDRACVYVNLF